MKPTASTIALLLTTVALGGCSSGETISGVARRAARAGNPCEALEVEPENAALRAQCLSEQRRQLELKEARARVREGEQLKAQAEGRKP